MKEMGIVRKIDLLGRIVLPCEFRKMLDLKKGSEVEIFATNGTITIKKHKKGCVFCGREKILINYRGFKLCMSCVSILQSLKLDGNSQE